MALPTWKDVSPNYSGSNTAMANAQRGIAQAGAMADSIVDNYRKDELLKLQEEQLGMQKAEYQMKVDAVAQAAKEKEAANRYADVLGAATSGNVIGVPDQKILGEQVAAMGEKAQAAYASGNKGLGDEIVAQQESYINSVLPKMTKAYEASPEAQLQVLRGTNPLGGTGDLAPQTRLALLKEAEAPIEKKADRIQAFADQKALLAEQAKMQEAADTRREARDDKKWKAMQDIAEAKESRVLEKTTKAQQQKDIDKAYGLAESLKTRTGTLDLTDPDNKVLNTRVNVVLADLNAKRDKGLPVTTALDALDKLNKELEVTEERTFKRQEADKKDFADMLSKATNSNALEMSTVLEKASDMTDDKQVLKDKYGKQSVATLLKDVYPKLSPERKGELKGIMSRTDVDAILPFSDDQETGLRDFIAQPDVLPLLGVKPRNKK